MKHRYWIAALLMFVFILVGFGAVSCIGDPTPTLPPPTNTVVPATDTPDAYPGATDTPEPYPDPTDTPEPYTFVPDAGVAQALAPIGFSLCADPGEIV